MYTASTHMLMLYSILNNSIARLVCESIKNTNRHGRYEMRHEALESQQHVCKCVCVTLLIAYDGCLIAIVQTPAPGQTNLAPHKH